jgi:hypothetical protein
MMEKRLNLVALSKIRGKGLYMTKRVLRNETASVKPAGKKKADIHPAGFNDVFQREILNREQAAVFTTLSVEVLDKAVVRGDLASHREGARVLFLRDELIAYISRLPAKSRKRETA